MMPVNTQHSAWHIVSAPHVSTITITFCDYGRNGYKCHLVP